MISDKLKLETSDLYANGELLIFSDGTSVLRTNFIEYVATDRDKYHTVKRGDNLRKLAWEFYQDQRENPQLYWHYIAKANNIINPLDIEPLIGVEIVIPDIVNFELFYL